MRQFAIKIDLGGIVFRFSTDRVSLVETIGSQDVEMYYLPFLIEASDVKSELSLEGTPSVPTMNVKISDAYGDLRTELEKGKFQRAACTVSVLEEGEFVRSFIGYLSEPDYDEGVVSFTVRMEEDGAEQRYLDLFSYNSFQYSNVVTPLDVNIQADWEFHETCPWTIEHVQIAGGRTHGGVTPAEQTISVRIPDDDPVIVRRGNTDVAGESIFTANTVFIPYTTSGSGAYNSGNTRFAESNIVFSDSSQRITLQPGSTFAMASSFTAGLFFIIVGSAANDGLYLADTVTDDYIEVSAMTPIGGDEEAMGGVRIYWGTLEERFPDGSVTEQYLILGEKGGTVYEDSHVKTTSKVERVGYIGTPSEVTGTRGYRVLIPGVGLGAAVTHPVRYHHNSNEAVHPEGMFDMMVVATNGYQPTTTSGILASTGFIHIEDDVKPHPIGGGVLVQHDSGEITAERTGKNYRIVNRYSAEANSTDVTFLTVHNQPLDPAHTLAVRSMYNVGYQLRRVERGTPVRLADFYWTISSMTIGRHNPLDSDLVGASALQDNRLRGHRVDMVNSIRDLRSVQRSGLGDVTPQEISEQNIRLMNNAARFAVCTGSTESGDETTIYFHSSEFSSELVTVGYIDGEEVEDLGFDTAGNVSQTDDQVPYTNLFRYNVNPLSVSELTGYNSMGYEDAKAFFLTNQYRIIHDPVPQNADSLGKTFPIVYGRVEKVPLLHVISNKVLKEDNMTAGDDVYIYASHKCQAVKPYEIDVEIIPEEGSETSFERIQGLPVAYNRHAAESPFPKVGYNHHKFVGGIVQAGHELQSPYFKTVKIPSLQGKEYYGIKLLGSEWDSRLGSLDKRYPIRHGVGSTTLYGTFGGKVNGNQLLQHPVDIIRDYVITYGRFPYSVAMLDEENLETVKSQTRHLKVAIFLDEELSVLDLIDKLCRQTGLSWYNDFGTIKLVTVKTEPSEIDWAKPLSQHLNIVHGVKAKDAGSQYAFSRVTYNYNKNWKTGKYNKVIDLKPENNRWCAKANAALGSKKSFVVDADWVNVAGIAFEVATKIASRVSRHRIEYDMEAIYSASMDAFRPGDFIPVTYTPLNLDNTPMLVQAVEEGDHTQKLNLVRFI